MYRGAAEGEGEIQGGQQRTRRHVRRTHWLLGAVVVNVSLAASSSIQLFIYSTSPPLLLLSRQINVSLSLFESQRTKLYCWTFTTPAASFLHLYFTQENFCMLYFIIIL